MSIPDDLAKVESTRQWWVYFMVLSALIPTLIHFALAGGGATLWLPRKARLWPAKDIESDKHKSTLAWVYLTFTPVLGFFLIPAGLLYFLWSLVLDSAVFNL